MVYRPQYPLGWGARPDTQFHGDSFIVICHQFMVDVVLSLEPETGDKSSTERTRNYTRCGSLPVFPSCSLTLRSPRVLWLPLHALRVPALTSLSRDSSCLIAHPVFLAVSGGRTWSCFVAEYTLWTSAGCVSRFIVNFFYASAGTRSTAKGPLISLRPRVDTPDGNGVRWTEVADLGRG